jgi:predicted nucleotidyltransferase
MIDERTLQEIGHRLTSAAPQARVILYGSHARGQASDSSDLDLLVIAAERDDGHEAVRLMRVLRDLRVPVEIVVVSEHDVAARRNIPGSFIHTALSEGRPL